MTSETLRQEIADTLFENYHFDDDIEGDCKDCARVVDRICEAIGKTAEGMPMAENLYRGTAITGAAFKLGIKEQLEECQAYWQKELGK